MAAAAAVAVCAAPGVLGETVNSRVPNAAPRRARGGLGDDDGLPPREPPGEPAAAPLPLPGTTSCRCCSCADGDGAVCMVGGGDGDAGAPACGLTIRLAAAGLASARCGERPEGPRAAARGDGAGDALRDMCACESGVVRMVRETMSKCPRTFPVGASARISRRPRPPSRRVPLATTPTRAATHTAQGTKLHSLTPLSRETAWDNDDEPCHCELLAKNLSSRRFRFPAVWTTNPV